MLSKEQNELVTQTGAGSPMGDLFRCYWLPVLLSARWMLLETRALPLPQPRLCRLAQA